MWAKRKKCSILGYRVALLVTMLFLLLSINGLLISLWCTRSTPPKVSIGYNHTKASQKFRSNKSHRSRFSYDPKDFYRLDEMLRFPVKNDKEPELIACDEYLGKPDDAQLTVKDHWRFIDDGKQNETYVYSAYYDPRQDPPSVRILGMSSGVTLDADHESGLKYCYVWFAGRNRPDVMGAGYEVIPETHGRIYAASIYQCVLARKDLPVAVALSIHKCKRQRHFLRVIANHRQEMTHNFTVCVTPFSFEFNNAAQLVEMVEINKLFGADRFTFYDYSIGPLVSKVLKSYSSEGLVEVLEWDVPVNVDTNPLDPTVEVEIHYFAQLVSLNDCLYRNMFKSKFVVFSDLDELIVPQMHDTWFDMIRHATAEAEADLVFVRKVGTSEIFPSSFLIRNNFFPLQWKSNLAGTPDKSKLYSLQRSSNLTKDDVEIILRLKMNSVLVTGCESESYNWYIRSKYIVWTQLAETVAVHQVHVFLTPQASWQVPVKEHVGLLHHYRQWHGGQQENSSKSCTRLHHFVPRYLPRVAKKIDSLFSDNV